MTDTARTPWQKRQHAILDGCWTSIQAMPPMVRRAIEYGPYRECRNLVDMLDGPRRAGSAHGTAEKMVRELATNLALIVVKVNADGR